MIFVCILSYYTRVKWFFSIEKQENPKILKNIGSISKIKKEGLLVKKKYTIPMLENFAAEGLTTLVSLDYTEGEVEISGGDLFGVDNLAE